MTDRLLNNPAPGENDAAERALGAWNYVGSSVSCKVCGAKLTDTEREFLDRDQDFLAHGDGHLIRR